MPLNGSTGEYQWFTDGTPGIYTMTVTLPTDYIYSSTCTASVSPFDPTGGPDPTSLGASENGSTGFMTSFACTTYYLTFDLETGDPFVIHNNIAITPTYEIHCANTLDDDGDGLIDCDDPDCGCCNAPNVTIGGN